MNDDHKLNQKLQVLLSKHEVEEINRLILQDAFKNKKKPVSTSFWIRRLIQKEIRNNQNS
jgi:hypothetical protein